MSELNAEQRRQVDELEQLLVMCGIAERWIDKGDLFIRLTDDFYKHLDVTRKKVTKIKKTEWNDFDVDEKGGLVTLTVLGYLQHRGVSEQVQKKFWGNIVEAVLILLEGTWVTENVEPEQRARVLQQRLNAYSWVGNKGVSEVCFNG